MRNHLRSLSLLPPLPGAPIPHITFAFVFLSPSLTSLLSGVTPEDGSLGPAGGRLGVLIPRSV